MAKILAIRFSALGDIAMAMPVLDSFATRYPQHQVTLLSRPVARPLMEHLPDNVHFRGIQLDNYKGLSGMRRLYEELKLEHYDAVADLHDVLRTKLLRTAFRHDGTPVAHIDKSRRDRRALTRRCRKRRLPLTSSPQRYADVFAKLGYPFTIQCRPLFTPQEATLHDEALSLPPREGIRWIGIAPFARHKGKILPLTRMERVIALLSAHEDVHLFLLGAGAREKAWCDNWSKAYPRVTSLVGRNKMDKELALMACFDAMLTMDSANMHLAALCGTPTVSIWGATHPYAGFAGLPAEDSVQLQAPLSCRPCSIFGNKPCRHGTYPCLWNIQPEEVVRQVLAVASRKPR